MSSYQPLADHLASRKEDSWDASFGEIEQKLGRPLPPSAYRHNAWWANQTGPGHSQTHGWRSVGWKTAKLDLEGRRVRFERERSRFRETPRGFRPEGGEDDEALFEQARQVSGIADRAELIRAALGALIEREAVRGLIALGGTMPDFEAAPRRRSWS
jgi:Bacterial antitoxin of type II TA system, VapB